SIAAAYSTTCVLSSATSAAPSPAAPAPPAMPPSAAITASLSSKTQQDEAAPGGSAGTTDSDRRAWKRQDPARMTAPSAKLSSGHAAPRGKRRHGQHAPIITPAGPRPPPVHMAVTVPAGHATGPAPPWNRSRRRPAHGQHTCRQQRRPVTTRTRPATQVWVHVNFVGSQDRLRGL